MTTRLFKIDRRKFLAGLGVGATIPSFLASGSYSFAQTPRKGGTLKTVAWPATTYLNSAITTAGPEAFLSPKFYDGLIGYEFGLKPKPSLAESWEISEDGKRVTFHLRPGVKWHDGEAFTSRDVAFTFMKVLKVVHGRGRTTFAGLTDVETPDDLTAVFVLEGPAPAMMKALDARESPILPAHIYDNGADVKENPSNTAPIGTGAFILKSYERGVSVVMDRNPDYWDKDLPLLDRIIVQYVSDPSTRVAMLESGEVDAVFLNLLPSLDTIRLGKMPEFEVDLRGFETSDSSQQMDFNLDNPILANVLVRRAIAHALDAAWITENVWHGFGKPGVSPLHHDQVEFYKPEGLSSYPYNLAKAEELLDEAGYKRGADNMRFKLMLDPSPWGTESITASGYVREQLKQIGIDCEVRTQDFAVFVKTVWTERKHDLCLYTASMGADPVIGVQRFYWSKNFKLGVGFSNGSNYNNPEVDALLEAAQVELDPKKRFDQYYRFQQIIMEELPTLPVTTISQANIVNRKVHDFTIDAVGTLGNMAHCWIDA